MGNVDGEEAMPGLRVREEERILVSVRLRPLNEKEAARNDAIDWECVDDTTILYKNNSSPERSLYPHSFTFDRVFRSDCSTRQVYEQGAKTVVLSAVTGINSSVFAYGQTSSGKTFTMSGITEYTMVDIFDYIHKHKEREFHLRFSAMEIYNESVRDLLTADHSPLRLLDDPERGTVVEKLTEETLRDWDHFKELLAVCEAQRQIGETFLNEASSRSHQILRLTIESSTREFVGKNNCSNLAATLNFVDLAGSERASQALSAGSRLKEGSHINRSLLTLGTVIRKLSKGQTGHIPYRDSKLTRILQSSLGGNARTAVICTMSPARIYVEQSRNTLLFASCAKEVTTNARVNVVMSDKALVKHLQRELARLEDELRTTSPSSASLASSLLREKDSKIEELERRVKELNLQLGLALSQIQNLQQGVEERRPVIWQEESAYPRLVVRQTSESSSSDTSPVDRQSYDANSPPFEAPQSPDRHSRLSYDENYSGSDFDDNLPPSSPSERRFIETPSDDSSLFHIQTPVENSQTSLPEGFQYIPPTETEHQTPNSIESEMHHMCEENGEEVSETFEIHLQQVSEDYGSQSPYFEVDTYQTSDDCGEQTHNSEEAEQYPISEEILETASNYNDIDPQQTAESTRQQTVENLEDHCKEVQCIESGNLQANVVPPEEENKSSVIMDFENNRCTYEPKEECELENVNSSYLEETEELSSRQPMDDELESQNLECVESSSQLNSMSGTSSSAEDIKFEIRNESGDEEYIVKFKDIQRKLSVLKNDAANEVLQNSVGDVVLDVTQDEEVGNFAHMNTITNYTSLRKDFIKAKSMDQIQLLKLEVEDSLQKQNNFTKNVKDIGLNPQDDLDDIPPCPQDVMRLQKEIIDLWDVCNTSLVHRTCFFLLFIKDDQADTIYMEVERRRLSYIQDAFSWGKSIILDGRQLTPSSSSRSLHNERKMLSKLMKRRLSSQERRDLYTRWGIALNGKRRRSQLVDLLWVDTIDMDHILESANVVAKLVRFSEPKVPKEVFGLNLTATKARRKSFGWKQSPSHLMKNTFSKA